MVFKYTFQVYITIQCGTEKLKEDTSFSMFSPLTKIRNLFFISVCLIFKNLNIPKFQHHKYTYKGEALSISSNLQELIQVEFGMVVQACNPSTSRVQGQPHLRSSRLA